MPTIEEGEVIKEFRTRNEDLDTRDDDYPSYYDNDKKIHIDYAHNLKFSCMIGFEFIHVNFFPLLYVNVMSKKFHNSIMKDKMVYKGDNVVGAVMNVPIFVGTFSVVSDFAVLEDMNAYRDEGMGDVIVGEPFLREVGIKKDIILPEAILNSEPSSPLPNHADYFPGNRKELKICEAKTDETSIDEPPEVELKDLPPHLEYAFLEGDNKLPVFIAKDLSIREKTALIKVLQSHKRAIAWKLSYIKGINPEFCTHKILMEEDYTPAVQH
ncbi:hypothetical protein Tco_1579943 [Tanacetum coccineum]